MGVRLPLLVALGAALIAFAAGLATGRFRTHVGSWDRRTDPRGYWTVLCGLFLILVAMSLFAFSDYVGWR